MSQSALGCLIPWQLFKFFVPVSSCQNDLSTTLNCHSSLLLQPDRVDLYPPTLATTFSFISHLHKEYKQEKNYFIYLVIFAASVE